MTNLDTFYAAASRPVWYEAADLIHAHMLQQAASLLQKRSGNASVPSALELDFVSVRLHEQQYQHLQTYIDEVEAVLTDGMDPTQNHRQ